VYIGLGLLRAAAARRVIDISQCYVRAVCDDVLPKVRFVSFVECRARHLVVDLVCRYGVVLFHLLVVLVHGDVLMSRRRPLSIAFNHCNVNYVINSFVFCVSYMQSAFAFAVQDVSAFL